MDLRGSGINYSNTFSKIMCLLGSVLKLLLFTSQIINKLNYTFNYNLDSVIVGKNSGVPATVAQTGGGLRTAARGALPRQLIIIHLCEDN